MLSTRINSLRGDFIINSDQISELQAELNRLVELEIQGKILNMKLFEGLHSEKPSPIFLSLAKKRNSGNLSVMKDDTGTAFASPEAQGEYIATFFENLYRAPPDEDLLNNRVIEDFLGDDICQSNLVRNSKISEAESAVLDRPLSLDELDKSINNCNLKSAAGQDGLSNIVIKKCWPLLRRPLLKYANCCYNKGELTSNFRSACIRLIPKKGTCSSIKNWRPISLLSNLYKILSRALNARLDKIVNRICSRSQKGFNRSRYTQEVLINVWETISMCRKKNINAAIMAVDMAKAFDTLSNNFLDKVLRFFNLGPNIRKWLALIGNKRTACVLLEDGLCSRSFNLGRGRPQGDTISPTTFNFCMQILIFRIELDPGVEKIPRDHTLPIPIHNLSEIFRHESNRETSKNEGLADDNTTLTMVKIDSLTHMKQILQEFSTASGLVCNYDKSSIMPINQPDDELRAHILNLGFSLVTSFKLLGLTINNTLDNIHEIYMELSEKISSLINFWTRFKLTLPGRLTIMKTCLVSQLNYIGCFLPVSDLSINQLQLKVNNFVKGSLQVSSERLYLDPEHGGLGIFNLKQFFQAQHCSWIKRAHAQRIDNWRYDLARASPDHNILQIKPMDLDPDTDPILRNFAISFSHFYS